MKSFVFVYLKENGKKEIILIKERMMEAAATRFVEQTEGWLIRLLRVIELQPFTKGMSA